MPSESYLQFANITYVELEPFMIKKNTPDKMIPIPNPTNPTEIWGNQHVRLPFYSKNETRTDKKWDLIKNALKSPIRNVKDLERCVSSYWEIKNFNSLRIYVNGLSPQTNNYFFNKILPKMIEYLINMTECTLTSPIPLLQHHQSFASLTFSQFQIFILLINAFFCTYPEKLSSDKIPKINFDELFYSNSVSDDKKVEKIKCLINYFVRVMKYDKYKINLVTFIRKCIPQNKMPRWNMEAEKLAYLTVNSNVNIEDQEYTLQVDFANYLVGGGVLSYGLVQEEILFLIYPELLVCRLFNEKLADNQVLFITGFERFNKYSGYGSDFKFIGDYYDETKIEKTVYGNRRLSFMVAMDAKSYKIERKHEQYQQKNIIRELNKCYVAFAYDNKIERDRKAKISTGNWGCGAFNGDPELKSLIQLLVASYCKRDIIYSTFGDVKFEKKLKEIYNILKFKSVDTTDLFKLLIKYDNTSGLSLFGYIKEQLQN